MVVRSRRTTFAWNLPRPISYLDLVHFPRALILTAAPEDRTQRIRMNNRDSRGRNDLRAATPLPWWLAAIVIVGSILMIAGGLIALLRPEMLLPPHQEITQAVHVYAGYLVSRNLALGLMLLAALSPRARGSLSTLMVLYASIQFLDAVTDCVEARWAVVPGDRAPVSAVSHRRRSSIGISIPEREGLAAGVLRCP
jgi:hypothetical protein